MRMRPAFLLCPFLVLGVASCSVGLRPPTILCGRDFDLEAGARLEEGSSREKIAELLGEPFEILETHGEDEVILRYVSCGAQDDVVRLFGVVQVQKRPLSQWVKEVQITVLDERLTSMKVIKLDLLDRSSPRRSESVCKKYCGIRP